MKRGNEESDEGCNQPTFVRVSDAEVDRDYFGSYAHPGIHEEMLRDTCRTGGYREAIIRSSSAAFRGKVVLDVGCGTGILSLFAAEAGARKVYAVDASDIAVQAKKIVEHNRKDGVITVIQSKVEDLQLPEKVDVIVSEWMGYFLLFESMLESLIVARDRFLKPGGLMYPAEAKLFLAPFADLDEDQAPFWYNVYGYDFSPIMPYVAGCKYHEPLIDGIEPQQMLSLRPQCVFDLDCSTVTKDTVQRFTSRFEFSSIATARVRGFAAWFDVTFRAPSVDGSKPFAFVLSTSPNAGSTHWRQTIFAFDSAVPVAQDDTIRGEIEVVNNAGCKRCTSAKVTFCTTSVADGKQGPAHSKDFHLH